jgi:hypothetical protein
MTKMQVNKTKAKPFRVRVTWSELCPIEYTFATEAELEAFCYGIDQYDIERSDGPYNEGVCISRRNADGTYSQRCAASDEWEDDEFEWDDNVVYA